LKTNHCRAMASSNARGTARPPAHRLQPAAGSPLSAMHPSPARQRMICASVYLLVFIQNPFMNPAEKIPLMQPLTFGGITAPPFDLWRIETKFRP
jgi:hypothetical protein